MPAPAHLLNTAAIMTDEASVVSAVKSLLAQGCRLANVFRGLVDFAQGWEEYSYLVVEEDGKLNMYRDAISQYDINEVPLSFYLQDDIPVTSGMLMDEF